MLYFTTWGSLSGCCHHAHRTLESAACCARQEARRHGSTDRAVRVLSSRDRLSRYERPRRARFAKTSSS